MAVTLDEILNFIIPPAVFIFLVFICLYPFREPLGRLWASIKSWREERSESGYEERIVPTIEYE